MEAPLGPVRCRECEATWHAIHTFSFREGCIRCGGELEAADRDVGRTDIQEELLMSRAQRRARAGSATPGA